MRRYNADTLARMARFRHRTVRRRAAAVRAGFKAREAGALFPPRQGEPFDFDDRLWSDDEGGEAEPGQ